MFISSIKEIIVVVKKVLRKRSFQNSFSYFERLDFGCGWCTKKAKLSSVVDRRKGLVSISADALRKSEAFTSSKELVKGE